jgi:hypothetical protein
MPPRAARWRSWQRVLVLFDLRMLKAKLRRRANTPGLLRIRDLSSLNVTSRLQWDVASISSGREWHRLL